MRGTTASTFFHGLSLAQDDNQHGWQDDRSEAGPADNRACRLTEHALKQSVHALPFSSLAHASILPVIVRCKFVRRMPISSKACSSAVRVISALVSRLLVKSAKAYAGLPRASMVFPFLLRVSV